MRVIFFVRSAGYLAGNNASWHLPLALAEKGHKITVVYFNLTERLHNEDRGVDYIHCRTISEVFCESLNLATFDAIHVFWTSHAFKILSLKSVLKHRKNVFIDFRSPILLSQRNKILRRKRISKVCAPFENIVSPIKWTAEDNLGRKLLEQKSYYESPIGVSDLFFRERVTLQANHKNNITLGIVSSLDWKRKQYLPIIYSYLASWLISGRSINLVIWGHGNSLQYLRIFRILNFSKFKLDFRGVIEPDELARELQSVDAFIVHVPQKHYGTSPSLKVLEYMAVGRPIFSYGYSTTKFVERFGAVFAHYKGPSSFLRAVRNLDAIPLSTLLENREVAKRFRWNCVADLLLKVYKK